MNIDASIINLLERFTPIRGWPLMARYGCTFVLVLLCFLARYLLGDKMPYSPFLIFMPAIFIAGLIFDRGSSFLATLLGAGLGFYFFTPQDMTILPAEAGTIGMVIFILIGLLTSFVVEVLHKTVHALTETNRRLAENEQKLQKSEAELRKSDKQKTLLLDDINHRVKNSLHAVMGLLEMGARKVTDEHAKLALDGAARQLLVLARVFDRLHLSQSGSSVSAEDFITGLCADLNHGVIGQRPIALRAKAAPASIGIERAISIGLIINELVSNALKYAFPEEERGVIIVGFDLLDAHTYCLTVRDNGRGIAADMPQGSGQRLVQSFAAQLGGTAKWEGPPGTAVIIRFPVREI
ncbi:MAG: sensor histidine kinase [Micavibrio sp.]